MGGGCCHWQRSWPSWSRRWGSRSWGRSRGRSRVRSAETAAPADCRHTASWSRPWTHRFFQGADDAGAFPVVCAGSPRVGPGPAEALDTPLPGAGARRGRGAWRWRCGPGRCARPLGRADRPGSADGGCRWWEQMVGAVGDRLAVVPVPCTPLLLRPSMGGCRGGAYLGVGHTTSACGAPPDASGACRVARAVRGFRC